MASTWGAMLAIGAALGAGFTVLFGRDASFIADAVSFLVAGALIFSVRRPMREPGTEPDRSQRMRPLSDTADALRYAWHRPQVLALLGSKAGFGLGTGVVGLLAVLADKTFHAGDGGTGLLLTMRGLGVVAGPLLANRVAKRECTDCSSRAVSRRSSTASPTGSCRSLRGSSPLRSSC